jgi:hypothetical protein
LKNKEMTSVTEAQNAKGRMRWCELAVWEGARVGLLCPFGMSKFRSYVPRSRRQERQAFLPVMGPQELMDLDGGFL